ncbi:MAG: hypothetical protein V4568_05525 [Pseudomonadota bacterium]
MIGLIVLAITVPLLLGYLWVARAAVRYVKRKTGSNWMMVLTVIGILMLTFGDTLFNRWYHKNVLCKREDVGSKIFERVTLPEEYWDNENNLPKLPLTMSKNKPFLGRYAAIEKYEQEGFFPLTAYERRESSVVDIQTNKTLSRFVDYAPMGGLWWAVPLSLFGEKSIIGWLLSRGSSPSCFDNPIHLAVKNLEAPFIKISNEAYQK